MDHAVVHGFDPRRPGHHYCTVFAIDNCFVLCTYPQVETITCLSKQTESPDLAPQLVKQVHQIRRKAAMHSKISTKTSCRETMASGWTQSDFSMGIESKKAIAALTASELIRCIALGLNEQRVSHTRSQQRVGWTRFSQTEYSLHADVAQSSELTDVLSMRPWPESIDKRLLKLSLRRADCPLRLRQSHPLIGGRAVVSAAVCANAVHSRRCGDKRERTSLVHVGAICVDGCQIRASPASIICTEAATPPFMIKFNRFIGRRMPEILKSNMNVPMIKCSFDYIYMWLLLCEDFERISCT